MTRHDHSEQVRGVALKGIREVLLRRRSYEECRPPVPAVVWGADEERLSPRLEEAGTELSRVVADAWQRVPRSCIPLVHFSLMQREPLMRVRLIDSLKVRWLAEYVNGLILIDVAWWPRANEHQSEARAAYDSHLGVALARAFLEALVFMSAEYDAAAGLAHEWAEGERAVMQDTPSLPWAGFKLWLVDAIAAAWGFERAARPEEMREKMETWRG